MQTFMLRKEDITREWFVVDATDKTLGRLSTEVASLLRGKHKPTYTPHVDGGDYVIVINASKIKLTGNKLEDKVYYSHSGYPGGLKGRVAKDVLASHPDRIIEHSVKGMLPKGKLGRHMYKKLFVYANDVHPHSAQNPKEYTLKG